MRRRLLAAQAAVLLAAAVAAWGVALVAGPPVFRDHLHLAGAAAPEVEAHAVEAFRSAAALSIGGALVIAAALALLLTWLLTRRLQRSVAVVAGAAGQVAAGNYAARVAPPRLGAEFDTLAGSFNTMAARLDAVEQVRRRMLSDLAHELRTPVAVIDAYLEAVEDGVRPLDAETSALLRDQARRLVRLSQDVGALARAEEGPHAPRRERVLLAELLATTADGFCGRYAEKGVRLEVVATEGLSVWGDRERLGQVVGNLLDNALRHTPPTGRVRLSAAPAALGAVVAVEDTGEGVAPEHLPHLFERFYRADPSRARDGDGGAGIGLAIAKAIVDQHGGRATATSAGPGKGARFQVWLP